MERDRDGWITIVDDDTEHVMPTVAWKDYRRMQDALFTRCPCGFRTGVSLRFYCSNAIGAGVGSRAIENNFHENDADEAR